MTNNGEWVHGNVPGEPVLGQRRSAGRLLHLAQEARIIPLRVSWEIRSADPLPRRIALVALVAVLGTPPGLWLLVTYVVGAPLPRTWRVIGTGREQIVCVLDDHPGVVRKLLIDTFTGDPGSLAPVVDRLQAEAEGLRAQLGELCAPTDYAVLAVNARRGVFAVGSTQPRYEVVDSVFHGEGELSPATLALSPDVRRAVARQLTRLIDDTGLVPDVLGMGNLVFTRELELPVLIDNIPIRFPLDGRLDWIADEVRGRLDALDASDDADCAQGPPSDGHR